MLLKQSYLYLAPIVKGEGDSSIIAIDLPSLVLTGLSFPKLGCNRNLLLFYDLSSVMFYACIAKDSM